LFSQYGSFVYRRRWLIVALWLSVLLLAAPLVPQLPGLLKPAGFTHGDLESERVHAILESDFGLRPSSLLVLVTRAPDDPTALDSESISRALDAVQALPDVNQVSSPIANPRQMAADQRTAYLVASFNLDPDEVPARVPAVEAALDRALAGLDVEVIVAGGPVAFRDLQEVSERDLRRAELVSVPLALVALLVVFGSLVAAGLPVLIGGVSVGVALGVLTLLTSATDLSIFVLNLSTMLGLGLGTDYSLFIVSRFREELAGAGADRAASPRQVMAALDRTMVTAGRAVLFSGLTVFIGLTGLIMFEFMMLRSLGIGGTVVVALAVFAALTLLPAMLAVLGPRVNALSFLPRFRYGGQGAVWAAIARFVMARPVPVLVGVLIFLIVLGLPFTRARFSFPDASILPPDVASRQAEDVVRRDFGPGEFSPILVLLEAPGDVLSPARLDALYDFVRFVEQDSSVQRVESIVSLDPRLSREQYHLMYANGARHADAYARGALEYSTRPDMAMVTVIPVHPSVSQESKDLVARIRSLQPGADLRLSTGGGPSAVRDIVEQMYRDFPRVILYIVLTTYLTLFLLFRSVVLPIKAVIINALSLLASYGALVVVFQEGFLSDLLGFTPLGFVEASLPIIMFCLLFGLSMDYEVFLLTRIKEAYDRLGDNTASVAIGMERSGRVITNAALIVVVVAASFVTADIILIKAVGLGTAVAVFVDATICRALLVPAMMRLLGDWNWWSPRFVRRYLPEAPIHES
jgi:putative drug exporter of the RND superfamily